ncbi:MAG: hypothetical protein QXT45_02880 [Candidatus Bilamarchaeaceae archaeon]
MLSGININKRVALAVAITFIFMFVLFTMLLTYNPTLLGENQLFAILATYHIEFMVGTSLSGVAVGALVFYLMQEKIETKQKESKDNVNILLSFLDPAERKTVDYLVRAKGSAYQSEIGRLEEMNRLKAYRAVKRLKSKGVITIEKNGKARRITLSPAILDALSR